MKKGVLILLVFVFLFLIFQISKDMWVETKLAFLKNKMKEKAFIAEPSFESLFAKLQRLCPDNARVWSLASRYYFKKMTQTPTIRERISYIEKAYIYSLRALECIPYSQPFRASFRKIFRWRSVLSKVVN
jgi:hypothetical protein